MKLIHEDNLGDLVLCDLCNTDFTNSKSTGGFVFESKAVCPICAPRFMQGVEKYGEQHYIRATNDSQTTFADFIRRYRGPGGGVVRIYTLD